jgi:hypothetical protein
MIGGVQLRKEVFDAQRRRRLRGKEVYQASCHFFLGHTTTGFLAFFLGATHIYSLFIYNNRHLVGSLPRGCFIRCHPWIDKGSTFLPEEDIN